MSKLYIFAIGGSGSRVLRSLTMLLASGVEMKSDIVPMIVDPDANNGDLTRVVEEMRLYKSIRSELTYNENTKNRFFSTKIDSLNNDGQFLLPLEGTSGVHFDSYIGLNTMSRDNQAMMKMLFSDSNLSSTMDVGFKGNPNIGSIVLSQFTQSTTYRTFETNFVPGDKVFIISSIFGGTGASGFPLFLKTMRTSKNSALVSCPIGAISLLPYFNLKDNPKSSIKADSFVTKMKAALNYYEKNVTGNGTLNEMYYLGDQISGKPYDNCDGGNKQRNDAHVIELFAALAAIDFDSKVYPPNLNRKTIFHEFGLDASPKADITFSDLGQKTRLLIMKPLVQMALLNSYLNNREVSHRKSQFWAKEDKSKLGDSFFRSDFFNNFISFKFSNSEIGVGFEHWINQMSKNDKSFAPFADDETIARTDGLAKVIGRKPHYGFFSKKGYDLIDQTLNNYFKRLPKDLNAPSSFFEIFYNTTSDLCSNNLDI